MPYFQMDAMIIKYYCVNKCKYAATHKTHLNSKGINVYDPLISPNMCLLKSHSYSVSAKVTHSKLVSHCMVSRTVFRLQYGPRSDLDEITTLFLSGGRDTQISPSKM